MEQWVGTSKLVEITFGTQQYVAPRFVVVRGRGKIESLDKVFYY
jgi:hypothetical protein